MEELEDCDKPIEKKEGPKEEPIQELDTDNMEKL